jgi:hypothetical protein
MKKFRALLARPRTITALMRQHARSRAACRDLLAAALVRLERAWYPVVLHVHDEIIAEVPEDRGSVEEFERIMSTPPAWAHDWPVRNNQRTTR